MPSNLVEEIQLSQYYVGPMQTGGQNYQACVRLMYALKHAVKFWDSKVIDNKDSKDYNGLMVLCALTSIADNLLEHVNEIKTMLEMTKGDLVNSILPRAMKEQGQDNVIHKDQKFVLSGRFSAKFTDEDKGFAWLKEIGEDAAVKYTIHHATLSSIVKRQIEEKLMTPPNHVTVKSSDYVQIRKVAHGSR